MVDNKKVFWVSLIILVVFSLSPTLNAITYIKHIWYLDGKEVVRDLDDKLNMGNEFQDGLFIGYTEDGEKVTSPIGPQGVTIMDCEVGATIRREWWLDSDNSHTVTTGDVCLGVGYFTDGDTFRYNPLIEVDDNPVPDGLIKLWGDPGKPPEDGKQQQIVTKPIMGSTLHRIVDADGSFIIESQGSFEDSENRIKEKQKFVKGIAGEPPIMLTGKVIIEGVTPPSEAYRNFLVGQCPIFSGVDEYGNFELGFYDPAVVFYSFRPMLIDLAYGIVIPGMKPPIDLQKNTKVTDIVFNIPAPTAWVMGKITDQDGNPIGPICVELFEQITETRTPSRSAEFGYDIYWGNSIFVGEYMFRVIEGDYTFRVGELHGGLGPHFFLYPAKDKTIHLEKGDTLINDIVCYKPDDDSYIYVNVDLPDNFPLHAYPVEAYSDGYFMKVFSNTQTGMARIPVSRDLGDTYRVEVFTGKVIDERDNTIYKVKEEISIGDTLKVDIGEIFASPPGKQDKKPQESEE